jgi:hypothetical protein
VVSVTDAVDDIAALEVLFEMLSVPTQKSNGADVLGANEESKRMPKRT